MRRKLNARADRAEARAADAIDLAAAAICEAEEAILEAALARMDADERNRPRRPRAEPVGAARAILVENEGGENAAMRISRWQPLPSLLTPGRVHGLQRVGGVAAP